jgi:alpha-tubulin suppressor-like RCC1 family protein
MQPICKTVNEFTRINGPWTKDAEKVVAVTAGDMFSLFLTDAGYVYSAGYGQFGQLGHGFTGTCFLFMTCIHFQAKQTRREDHQGK